MEESLVGQLERLTYDMAAAREDLANKERIINDAHYEHTYMDVDHWISEIRRIVQEMLAARFKGTEIQVIYNPIEPYNKE